MKKRVLLFEERGDTTDLVIRTLEDHGYHVTVEYILDDVWDMLERSKFDLVIATMPDDAAFAVVEVAKERGIRTFLITGSSSHSRPTHAAAAKAGHRLAPEGAPADAAVSGPSAPHVVYSDQATR